MKSNYHFPLVTGQRFVSSLSMLASRAAFPSNRLKGRGSQHSALCLKSQIHTKQKLVWVLAACICSVDPEKGSCWSDEYAYYQKESELHTTEGLLIDGLELPKQSRIPLGNLPQHHHSSSPRGYASSEEREDDIPSSLWRKMFSRSH